MELCDAAWLSSISAEAAATEAAYAACLADQPVAATKPVAAEKKEKTKKGEKKKSDEDTARRRLPRHSYFMRPSAHPSFFPGRAADLYVNGQKVRHTSVMNQPFADNDGCVMMR